LELLTSDNPKAPLILHWNFASHKKTFFSLQKEDQIKLYPFPWQKLLDYNIHKVIRILATLTSVSYGWSGSNLHLSATNKIQSTSWGLGASCPLKLVRTVIQHVNKTIPTTGRVSSNQKKSVIKRIKKAFIESFKL